MAGFISRRIKKTANKYSRWADLPGIKKMYGFSRNVFSSIFSREDGESETFAEAVKRLKLTPEQLAERKKALKTQVLIYTLGALGVGIYAVYLIVQSYWISLLPCVLISIFLAVHALKSHFWLYQIKQQKLGCTVSEWFHGSIKELK